MRQEERAGDEVLRALRFATTTCKELMLFTPKQVTDPGKYVLLLDEGTPIFKVEYRKFPDQIVVTGDWQVTAKHGQWHSPSRDKA